MERHDLFFTKEQLLVKITKNITKTKPVPSKNKVSGVIYMVTDCIIVRDKTQALFAPTL